MNSIAQEARFRQRVVKFSQRKGVTEASRRFHLDHCQKSRQAKQKKVTIFQNH